MVEDLYGVPMAYVNDIQTGTHMLQAAKDQFNLLLSTYSSEFSRQSENKGDGLFSSVGTSSIPLVLAEFDFYMGPETVNTETCLGWIENDDMWRP